MNFTFSTLVKVRSSQPLHNYSDYSFLTGVWLTPTIKGTRPPACADFALNGVNLHRAVLFGGYQHNLSQEELYIIDFHEVKMVSWVLDTA